MLIAASPSATLAVCVAAPTLKKAPRIKPVFVPRLTPSLVRQRCQHDKDYKIREKAAFKEATQEYFEIITGQRPRESCEVVTERVNAKHDTALKWHRVLNWDETQCTVDTVHRRHCGSRKLCTKSGCVY
jgi:hypothetical protein